MPGAPNADFLQNVTGRWLDGFVCGDLQDTGWGATQGYPAMRWNPRAADVPIKLLVSDQLPDIWPRLDDFEGPGYQRVLVPVHDGAQFMAIANIYEAR